MVLNLTHKTIIAHVSNEYVSKLKALMILPLMWAVDLKTQ